MIINKEMKDENKNCTLPMNPTACLLFLRRLSLIKYRARTTSSEKKVLMCVFIEKSILSRSFLINAYFSCCLFFHSHTHTQTYGCPLNGCFIKYDEYGLFFISCCSSHPLYARCFFVEPEYHTFILMNLFHFW